MTQEKNNYIAPHQNSNLKVEQSKDNLSGRMITSLSNLTSGLGDLSSLQNVASLGEKGSSSQSSESNDATKEFQYIANDLPSSSKTNTKIESFSSKPAINFENQEPKEELPALSQLELLPDTLAEGDLGMYEQSHKEKLRKYRDSVENRNVEAEAFIDKEYGYFDGKFMSTQEMIESLNDQQFKKKPNPTYLPDVLEEDFLEDGQDVIQLLSEPSQIEEFAEEFLHSSHLLSQEEYDFLEILGKKYGFQERTPEDDIIKYLEGPDYLEEVYGLPELHSTRDRGLSGHSLTKQDKQKALDRLVLLKNHISTPADN